MKTSALLLIALLCLATGSTATSAVALTVGPPGTAPVEIATPPVAPATVNDADGTGEIGYSAYDEAGTLPTLIGLDYAPPPIRDNVDFFRLVLKMVLATAAAVALIFFFARLLGRRRAGALSGRIRVLDRTAVAPGRFVCLIEAHGRLLVVGVGESVTPLVEITDPAECRQILLDHKLAITGLSFEKYLQNLAGDVPPDAD